MSAEQAAPADQDQQAESGSGRDAARPIVSLEDFHGVDFLAPAMAVDKADWHALSDAYGAAARSAESAGQTREVHVYGLLAAICGFHFKVEDRAGVFGPAFVFGNRRGAIPDDFRGEQTQVLEAILPKVTHPALRARLADMVWTNQRSSVGAAAIAIDAYCEILDGLASGHFKRRMDIGPRTSFEEIDLVHRALQIGRQIDRKGPIRANVKNHTQRLYDQARNGVECIPFERMARLYLLYRLADQGVIASDAEAVAAAAAVQPKVYRLALKAVWTLAAEAHAAAKNPQASRTAQLQAVEQTLAMRDEIGTPGAAAHWIRTAIHELRHVSDTGAKREQLRQELLLAQERALDDFKVVSSPIDVGDIQERIEATFRKLSLSSGLLHFAAFTGSQPVDKLRKDAIEQIKSFPLSGLSNSIHTDADGKYVAEAPGTSLGQSDPSEEAIKNAIANGQNLWRQYLVAAYIEPARATIGSLYSVTERHLHGLALMSPFIPDTHAYTYALGFARFFQGDLVSACHLLVPQLEHSIRYVLRSANLRFLENHAGHAAGGSPAFSPAGKLPQASSKGYSRRTS